MAPLPKTIRVKIVRACIVAGQDGNVGDIFELGRGQAALLVSDGMAVPLDQAQAKSYSVTMEQPEHGDPIARKISSGPPAVTEKAGAKKE